MSVNADLYIEVKDFYARQMRVLDDLDIERFTATFTEDGSVAHPHRGEKVEGREAMRAKMKSMLPMYEGLVTRHWFDHFLIEPAGDDGLRVTYYSLVTQTDTEDQMRFFSSSSVEDRMVRVDGELRIRERVIHRDNPKFGRVI
ncbi:nuclear transport factor 2 family protein [Streptomyces dangxiongensis]|uniref:Nuclear transport factor 2 family protein n=1 Tax=Streptomyces dangxiongensis TaxID=1442032 RepID=A0A3G2JHT2_9ACTN|nr:nuclear transport factor 2 family protein [Streptomyces dangxiongensis]AYN41978.1 nuclear transport factor 2 family protein [Streptomyces dangxiongensis]